MNILDIAKDVLKVESEEILKLTSLLTEDFEKAALHIKNSNGKLIICGMGKSGHIGKKMAATFASTGTPSFYLHPAEAYHGDLGMIEKNDVIILISNSGETDEVLKLIPFLKSQGNTIISFSGNSQSTLALNADYKITIKVEREACPLQLAPMSSTTATLAMGDALAVALMKLKDFQDENFAEYHPGGSLGRKLLTKVSDVMRKDNLPSCVKDTSVIDVIHKITKGECGIVAVIENGKLLGVITDGDIRRAMENNEQSFFNFQASDLMTCDPKTIKEDNKIIAASEYMTSNQINILLVVNEENEFIGIIKMYDLGI